MPRNEMQFQGYTPHPVRDWEAWFQEAQRLAGALGEPIEDWHFVGDTGEPAFQNSWTNLNSDNHRLGFRRNRDGTVWVYGTIADGSAMDSLIFTLPEGYRPASQFLAETPGARNNNVQQTYSRIDITTSGTVTHRAWSSGTAPTGTNWLAIDIVFPLDGEGGP